METNIIEKNVKKIVAMAEDDDELIDFDCNYDVV
jgi:hypothetical protein